MRALREALARTRDPVADRSPGARLRAVAVILSLALGAMPTVPGGSLHAQGMASGRERALAPIPLPDNVEPPRVSYRDVAAEAGLGDSAEASPPRAMTYLPETTGTGVALIDYDNDGLLDVFLVGSGSFEGEPGGRPHTLYRNLGNLRFQSVSLGPGIGEENGWGQGACAGDFDGDGYTDLFVTHWGRDALLRNVDGSHFRDETVQRRLAPDETRWSTGCSFLDYDRDGDLDLFVAHYVDFDPDTTPLPGEAPQCEWKGIPIPCGPRGLAAESMSLFANNGAGVFRDVSAESGIETARRFYGLGVAAADFDGDGWTDIFVACDSTANLLFRNSGDGTFQEAGLIAGAAYNEDGREQAGMGVGIADFDGDGLQDLFLTNFAADTNTLYRNEGGGQFRDRTGASGLATVTRFVGWGADFLDFDRDGWPDLFAVNGHVAPSVDGGGSGETFAQPRLLFWNRGDGIFHPLSEEAGPGITDTRPSRGSAVGDLDNDGDLEIVVANIGQPASLLQNQLTPTGNWLTVRAVSLAGSDRIGARVRVTTGGRSQVGEVRSGGSYLSQGDFRLHFGLGGEESATVRVTWRSGTPAAEMEVPANRTVTIVEAGKDPP